jgi:hypothetical protein
MKTEHGFTLIIEGPTELTSDVLNSLYESGCDDATVSSRAGVISVGFDRKAPTAEAAIRSAIRDVESAGIGARVVRVEPDTVGHDIANDRLMTAVNSVLAFRSVITVEPGLHDLISLIDPTANTPR